MNIEEILARRGLMLVGRLVVPNPAQPDKARAFIRELRQDADDTERKATEARPYKARLLRQNARAARRDADRLEACLP